jgi:hypothetical protein
MPTAQQLWSDPGIDYVPPGSVGDRSGREWEFAPPAPGALPPFLPSDLPPTLTAIQIIELGQACAAVASTGKAVNVNAPWIYTGAVVPDPMTSGVNAWQPGDVIARLVPDPRGFARSGGVGCVTEPHAARLAMAGHGATPGGGPASSTSTPSAETGKVPVVVWAVGGAVAVGLLLWAVSR